MQYEREKKEILKEAGNKPTYKKIKDGDRSMLAEKIEVGQAAKKGEQLNFSGGANDTLSYVKALEIAEGMARDRGDDLTPESFAEAVEANPDLVPQLLKNYKTASTQKQNVAYFAMPPEMGQKSTSIGKEAMTNFNRDRRYAGAMDMLVTDFPQQEEFIIEDDNDDEFGDYDEMIDQEEFNGELIDDITDSDWEEEPIIISEDD